MPVKMKWSRGWYFTFPLSEAKPQKEEGHIEMTAIIRLLFCFVLSATDPSLLFRKKQQL